MFIELELELLIVLPWSCAMLLTDPRADCKLGVLGNAVDVFKAVPGNLLFILISSEAPLMMLKFCRLWRFYELFLESFLTFCWLK